MHADRAEQLCSVSFATQAAEQSACSCASHRLIRVLCLLERASKFDFLLSKNVSCMRPHRDTRLHAIHETCLCIPFVQASLLQDIAAQTQEHNALLQQLEVTFPEDNAGTNVTTYGFAGSFAQVCVPAAVTLLMQCHTLLALMSVCRHEISAILSSSLSLHRECCPPMEADLSGRITCNFSLRLTIHPQADQSHQLACLCLSGNAS